MLFEEQKEKFGVEEGDVPYVFAAFKIDENTIGHIASYKRKEHIRTSVAYYSGEKAEVKLPLWLTTAQFEEFLHDTRVMVAKHGYDVVEFSYRTRTIDDHHTAILIDEDHNLLTTAFLDSIINGMTRMDAYDNIITKARAMRA